MQWDLFCRVVDNYGDVGFAWRLAADLAGRGECVRLCIDDASALAWMAPGGAPGLDVIPWHRAVDACTSGRSADVVVETFGCGLPDGLVADMARRRAPPVWINLEHLSAEAFVHRSHGLPSPRPAVAGQVLTQWYFYPGFSATTGGLLRESDLAGRRAAFDRDAWLAARIAPALQRRDEERVVSLFCYDNPALPGLLSRLAEEPTLLLSTPGAAARQVEQFLGPALRLGSLRALKLPLLTQPDYDHLLWACDLNLVRGEDSFVRAHWAGSPLLWQPYPQDDGASAVKLRAYLDRFLDGAPAPLQKSVRAAFKAWNGLAAWGPLPALPQWRAQCAAWCSRLEAQPDLTTALQAFALSKC